MLRQVTKVERDGSGPNRPPQGSVKGDALSLLCVLVWAQGSWDERSVSREGCHHQLQAGAFLGSWVLCAKSAASEVTKESEVMELVSSNLLLRPNTEVALHQLCRAQNTLSGPKYLPCCISAVGSHSGIRYSAPLSDGDWRRQRNEERKSFFFLESMLCSLL